MSALGRQPKKGPSRARPNRYDQVWCAVHEKFAYRGRKEAKRARKGLHPGDHLSIYECGEPGKDDCYHLGHLPYHVLNRGTAPRNNEYVRSLGVAQ